MPKYISVFGRKIPIKYVTSPEMLKLYPNPQGIAAMGLWAGDQRTIYINNEYSKREQRYTLFHEVGHSIFTFTGLELILPAEIQEVIVQTFATLLEDILDQAQKFKV